MNANILALILTVLAGGFGVPVLAQTAAAADKSYNLELSYRSGQLVSKSITRENIAPLDHRVWPNDGWLCQVIGANGEILDSFKFSLPVVACRDQSGDSGLNGGCAAGDSADFNLNVPYYSNGAAVSVVDPNDSLSFTVDTIKFAELCGDNICAAGENYLSCAKDCRSGVKDGACDKIAEGVCDADCPAGDDADCKTGFGSGQDYIFLIILAVVSTIGIAGFIFWRKRSRSEF